MKAVDVLLVLWAVAAGLIPLGAVVLAFIAGYGFLTTKEPKK